MDMYDKLLKESAERSGERFISNSEFFSSNGKGCFYEGYVEDENGKWEEGPEIKQKRFEEEERSSRCNECKNYHRNCDCW